MKFIVVLACIAFAVIGTVQGGGDHDEKFKEAEAKCEKDSGVSSDVIAESKKGHFKDGDNMGCYAECVFKEIGFIKDGKMDEEVIQAAAKSKGGAEGDKSAKIADKCKEVSGSDMCDTAHKMYKCYWEGINA